MTKLTFDEIAATVDEFIAGTGDVESVYSWIKGLYYEPSQVEPDALNYVAGVYVRIGEYRRLVGWSLDDLKTHLSANLVSSREIRKTPPVPAP